MVGQSSSSVLLLNLQGEGSNFSISHERGVYVLLEPTWSSVSLPSRIDPSIRSWTHTSRWEVCQTSWVKDHHFRCLPFSFTRRDDQLFQISSHSSKSAGTHPGEVATHPKRWRPTLQPGWRPTLLHERSSFWAEQDQNGRVGWCSSESFFWTDFEKWSKSDSSVDGILFAWSVIDPQPDCSNSYTDFLTKVS